MKRFEGRVVVITGAGSGIGRATAQRFGAEGAKVFCGDVNVAGLEETVRSIKDREGFAKGIPCDVTNPGQINELVGGAAAEGGRLDAAINVAGIGGFKRSTEVSLDEWNRFLAINLTGPFLVSQAAIPHLLATKGALISVASVAGLKSHPYSAAYCASKGGLVNLTRALAVEYGRKGLRVNCVCPGGVETPMIQQFQLPDGVSQAALAKISPLGRLGMPAEVAATIAFLASEEASYINGSAVVVDGGMTA